MISDVSMKEVATNWLLKISRAGFLIFGGS